MSGINKVTVGFVVQTFDLDTKEYLKQEFIAGDDVSYENILGDPVDAFDMVQPGPLVVLKDHSEDGEKQSGVEVYIEADERWVWIRPKGYGDMTAADGHGAPIGLEFYEGRLRLIVYPDINEEEPIIIDLESAREENRKNL